MNSRNKENISQDVNVRIEREDLEERDERFQDEDEEDKNEHREDENCNAGAPAMKPGRGRPKTIRTGKPGRPAKRKHEVPIIDPQKNSSEYEDAIIAEVEYYKDSEELAGFTCGRPNQCRTCSKITRSQ